MATEQITFDGEEVTTLKELLKPGLRAIFIGINPSLGSARRGHYYQSSHGQHFWNQLREYNIVPNSLPPGAEDDAVFELGFGFADLIRLPTRSASDLPQKEKRAAVGSLVARLEATGDRPIIVFRYKAGWNLAHLALEEKGYPNLLWMPSPMTKNCEAIILMEKLQRALGGPTR